MKVLFFAISLLSLAPVFAQETTTQESVPAQLKIMGRGIKNASNGEVVLMACESEIKCDQVRLLKIMPGYAPQWLGNAFPIMNTIQVREDLQKWYDETSVDGVLAFLGGRETYSFTNQNGWNWTNSPLELKKKKFDRVISSMLYFAEYFHPQAPSAITIVPAPVRVNGICGTTGSVTERIQDCAHEKLGWQLVTRTSYQNEVWRDPNGLIWGSKLPQSFDYRGAKKACAKPADETGNLPVTFRLPTLAEFKSVVKNDFESIFLSSNETTYFWTSTKPKTSEDNRYSRYVIFPYNQQSVLSPEYDVAAGKTVEMGTYQSLSTYCVAREE